LDNVFTVSKEFMEENKLVQTGPKKGGPYSTKDKIVRRNEVYKLHFDYGYSARKIADLMKINRKTIDNDIKFLYSKIMDKWGYPDPEEWLLVNMENLEAQKVRVREELEGAKDAQLRVSLERLLLDIESRRIDLEFKLCNSIQRVHRRSTDIINKWLEKRKEKTRYINFWDTIRVTPKGEHKIKSILKQEKPFLEK
jgi:hypothetical protein